MTDTTAWTRCDETLPELDKLVWLADTERIWIGARADDVDGWVWARAYGDPDWHKSSGWFTNELEADDDHPTHWAPLPDPPEQE